MAVSGVVRGVEVGVASTDRPPGPMEMVVEVGGAVENCTVSSLTYGYIMNALEAGIQREIFRQKVRSHKHQTHSVLVSTNT